MKRDIVVIGGGPAGLSFARSLAGADLDVCVVEKSAREVLREPPMDGREIALTHLSVRILKDLGVWSRIPSGAISPIREAKVLDGDSPFSMCFDNRNPRIDALGYLVPNHVIRQALFEEIEAASGVDLITGSAVADVHTDTQGACVVLDGGETIEASLLVAADSRFSESRRQMGIPASMHDFSRVAIVCRMEHEKPHEGIAYECFHYHRTLAILPMSGEMSSVVITVAADAAEAILAMSEDAFNADIQQRFEDRLGTMNLIGERYAYPLVAVHADRFVSTRFALIGDAAVGMHPVTAHGFNLGLRGQDTLAREVRSALARGEDFGGSTVLKRYQSEHMRVTRPIYLGTNGIVSMFTNDAPPAKLLRKLILRFGDGFPPIKQLITAGLTETDAGKLPSILPPDPFAPLRRVRRALGR
jgi:ubiquinone biosynthesis UbiH/UbiF/VisC/COQ6 family hydroxylase